MSGMEHLRTTVPDPIGNDDPLRKPMVTIDDRPQILGTEFPWPLWNLVVIEVDDAFRGSILAAPDRVESVEVTGTVVAVGPGQLLDDGAVRPVAVDVGQRVFFRKYRGAQRRVEGTRTVYWMAPDTEVIAVVGSPDRDPRTGTNHLKVDRNGSWSSKDEMRTET